MKNSNLIIGGVYTTKTDERPHRVLAFDDIELLYDGWWEHKNDWGLKCHNSKVYFNRTSTRHFETSADLLRVDQLTEEEQKKYKLNLPFRTCRHKEITWTGNTFPNLNSVVTYCKKHDVKLDEEPVLNSKEIVLIPLGPNGGHKKSKVITADNGKWFTEPELLWKAFNTQAPFETCINYGVGLYRLGLEKKLASYYIGGYYDLAEFIKENENSTQQSVWHYGG